MTFVPFLDLQAAYGELNDELGATLQRVAASGWYLLGNELLAFETAFSEFSGSKYCIGVGNGLDAIRLSLTALGIGKGDDVLVPSHTFIATWLAVAQVGARPLPVEPGLDCFNLDPARLDEVVTDRTKAIIPVHLYGQPAEMQRILRWAEGRGIAVVADAAQAHGALINGDPIGGLGHATCWSFYPGKNLGALGDGGAVTTNDESVAERLRILRNYGAREKYVNREPGWNSRLDEIQSAALSVKLRYLNEWNERRRNIAKRYQVELRDCGLILPNSINDTVPVWHLFVVRHPRRDDLQAELSKRGVQTLIHYPIPPHLQEAFCWLGYRPGNFPLAEQLAKSVLSLPIGPHMTDDMVEYVIQATRLACAGL